MRRYPLVRYERQEKDVLRFLDEAADLGRAGCYRYFAMEVVRVFDIFADSQAARKTGLPPCIVRRTLSWNRPADFASERAFRRIIEDH